MLLTFATSDNCRTKPTLLDHDGAALAQWTQRKYLYPYTEISKTSTFKHMQEPRGIQLSKTMEEAVTVWLRNISSYSIVLIDTITPGKR